MSTQISVVDQVRQAFRPTNRLATCLGCLLGAVAPVVTYTVTHTVIDTSRALYTQPAAYIVAGGLLFSAYSVVGWARRAFSSPAKAIGWTILVEGTMTAIDIAWLGAICLAYLIAINAIATGCNLSLDRRAENSARRSKSARAGRAKPANQTTALRRVS